MDRSISEFLELRHASRTSLLPMPPSTMDERTGAAGIAYLFLMSSHALTLMTGVLAIVSLKELGPIGIWRNSELSRQVGTLAKLATDVAKAAEHALGDALSNMWHRKSALSSAEANGVDEIRANCEVYVTLLKNVALETRLTVIQQNLLVAAQPGSMDVASGRISGAKEVGEAIRQLIEQIMELELRFEAYEVKISSYRLESSGHSPRRPDD